MKASWHACLMTLVFFLLGISISVLDFVATKENLFGNSLFWECVAIGAPSLWITFFFWKKSKEP